MNVPLMSRFTVTAILLDCLAIQAFAQAIPNTTKTRFDDFRARIAQMQTSGVSRETTQDMVEQWIRTIGLEKLTVEKSRWCLEQCLPQKEDRREFTAVWTGRLTPPRSGQFVFSTCPININKAGPPDETVKHAIKVFINDRPVIDASFREWKWQGIPIQLDANQPVSLRAELTYASSDNTYGDSPHAFLYWESPGQTRQVVPSEVLTPSEGQGQGLRAEYHLMEGGKERTIVQQNPNIAFAWARCVDVAPRNPALVAAITQRLWELAIDPAYLASQVAEKPAVHQHPYFRNYTSSEYLSVGQRRQFLQTLLQNPQILQRVDGQQILRLYHSFRFGDYTIAAEVLGTWMQQRCDVAPEIAKNYFDANQRFYRTAALYLVCRAPNPEYYKIIQDRYLETSDGRCCLPSAYCLAYCHIMLGDFDDWIEVLNQKLKDEAVAGEKRVNWLIARAHAQSIRDGGSYRYELPRFDPLAGTQWLTEAHLVAEQNATRVRLYQEELARLTAGNSERRAKAVLQAATSKMPAKELQVWQSKSDAILKSWRDRRSEDDRAVRDAYLKTLAERKEEAAAQNDQDAVSRYQGLLETANAELK